MCFGSGISAMPSMHIAIATLNAFFLTATRQRALAISGWLFMAIIQFGAIYSGWHCAVDGYVSMVVVALIWVADRPLLPEVTRRWPHHVTRCEPIQAGPTRRMMVTYQCENVASCVDLT